LTRGQGEGGFSEGSTVPRLDILGDASNFEVTMVGRRKALLIGINYVGSQNQLQGCEADVNNMVAFLVSRGYSTDPRDMIIMTESRGAGPYYPIGANIIAAMDWLVSEPECALFLHYSGHGGQVPDPYGQRQSGYDSTIVPVDFEVHGQINSDILHRHLVSALPPNSTMFVVFDCCHSGSALELPWVYKADEDGNINLMDNFEAGMQLMGEAQTLIQGGFTFQKLGAAEHLLAGAGDFFKGLKHQFTDEGGEGLQNQDDFGENWSNEQRSVFMLSGCKDSQTSADAFIQGKHVGAMSDAFLRVMRQDHNWSFSYVEVGGPLRN
jgi:metacaspase-1